MKDREVEIYVFDDRSRYIKCNIALQDDNRNSKGIDKAEKECLEKQQKLSNCWNGKAEIMEVLHNGGLYSEPGT